MTLAIYVIVMIVYNILAFTIFKNYTSVFWASYAFMMLAFVVQFISMVLAFKTADVETAFFGIPLASLSFYYLFAELFVSAVFMIFQMASLTLALVLQIVLLAAFLVVAIISLMSRDTVQEMGETIRQKVASIKSINIDIDMLMQSCTDPELKASLRKVSETVKYSDPMTNASVANVEQSIFQKISELRMYCNGHQVEEAKRSCSELELLFAERNKMLLVSK